MKNSIVIIGFLVSFFFITTNIYAQDFIPPPPSSNYAETELVDQFSPQSPQFGIRYSTVKKLDYFEGDSKKILWARSLIDLLELGKFKTIKETFGIDSNALLSKYNLLNSKYLWPEEVKPGWITEKNNDAKKTIFLRTFYDRYEDTPYQYRYQIAIIFDEGKNPIINFNEGDKIRKIDEIIEKYYSTINSKKSSVDEFDTETVCSPPINLLNEWYEIAETAKNEKNYELAIENYEKCIWRNNSNLKYIKKWVISLSYAEKYFDLIKIMNENFPDDFTKNIILPNSLYQIGKYKEIVKLHNENNSIETKVLESYIALKKEKELEKELIKNPNFLILDPTESYQFYMIVGNKDEAQKSKNIFLKSFNEGNSESVKNYRKIASSYFHIGEFEKSVKYHKLSLIDESDKDSKLLDLSEALIAAKKYKESFDITTKLLSNENLTDRNKLIYLYLNLISGYLSNSDIKAVTNSFDQIIKKNNIKKEHSWEFLPFEIWYKNDNELTSDQVKYIDKIIESAKGVMFPKPEN